MSFIFKVIGFSSVSIFLIQVTHSSFRKSKVLDFSVGNWEKVLLLFTRLPGALYFMLDWESTFFMTGELEEELNSLLKLQVARLQKARGETEQTRSAGKKQGKGVTNQPDNRGSTTNIYCNSDVEHAGSIPRAEHFLSDTIYLQDCNFLTKCQE